MGLSYQILASAAINLAGRHSGGCCTKVASAGRRAAGKRPPGRGRARLAALSVARITDMEDAEAAEDMEPA